MNTRLLSAFLLGVAILMVSSVVSTAVESFIPNKLTKDGADPPCYTKQLRTLLQKQRKMHDKFKRTQNPQDWLSYTEAQNLTLTSMRDAYNGFHNETLFRNLAENPKRFWSYVKYTSGKTQSAPSLRDSNGNTTDDSAIKAELLNTAFRNCFTKEDKLNIPQFESRTVANMNNLEVNILGLVKQIKSLNKSKSTGSDSIPIRFLSE